MPGEGIVRTVTKPDIELFTLGELLEEIRKRTTCSLFAYADDLCGEGKEIVHRVQYSGGFLAARGLADYANAYMIREIADTVTYNLPRGDDQPC